MFVLRGNRLSELANLIKNKREEKDMSQEDLAKEVDVSAGAVCHWEKGLRVPGGLTMLKLVRVLELEIN